MTLKRFHIALGLCAVLLPAALCPAQATTQAPSRLTRALAHFDLGVSGIATFTKGVSGPISNPALFTPTSNSQSASTAAGALVSLRGQKSPYIGVEFNFGYARTAHTFACCNQNTVGGGTVESGRLTSQSNMTEYTVGYLARPAHKLFGIDPYLAAGGGALEFKPTTNGGQGLPLQTRPVYYYAVGVEPALTTHLGLRAGFRQLIYEAPDFGQNYLSIKKYTFTSEPQVGLYLHF